MSSGCDEQLDNRINECIVADRRRVRPAVRVRAARWKRWPRVASTDRPSLEAGLQGDRR